MKLGINEIYSYGEFSTDQIRQMTSEVKEDGLDPTPIFYRRPDAAESPISFIKAMPVGEIPYIVPDAFAGNSGTRLAESLSLIQLQKIGAEGDEYLKEAIRLALESSAKTKPNDAGIQELLRYVNFSPAWQI